MTISSITAALQLGAGAPGAAVVVPVVGLFGGECFRATCHKTGATWFHRTAGRHYCADCAAEINLSCKFRGEPPVCVRQR